MVNSIKLTRKGWTAHLALVQKVLELAEAIYEIPTQQARFVRKDCEKDRRDKIGKGFTKLQELIWETGAVSERIWKESQKGVSKDPDFDSYEHDEFDDRLVAAFKRFQDKAKELSDLTRSLYDPTAPEIVDPEVVYPGFDSGSGNQPEDPNQLKLPLKKPEPPTVDPSKLLPDYKSQAAHDDTATPDKGDDDE